MKGQFYIQDNHLFSSELSAAISNEALDSDLIYHCCGAPRSSETGGTGSHATLADRTPVTFAAVLAVACVLVPSTGASREGACLDRIRLEASSCLLAAAACRCGACRCGTLTLWGNNVRVAGICCCVGLISASVSVEAPCRAGVLVLARGENGSLPMIVMRSGAGVHEPQGPALGSAVISSS